MKIKAFLQLIVLSIALLGGLNKSSYAAGSCHGSFFNPITDPNWGNLFPITILGVSLGGGHNPPTLYEPPICICPSRILGIPMIGIGITFWEPLYIAEVQREPGCLASLGGLEILGGYQMQAAEMQGPALDDGNEAHMTRMQVHWYMYPIFAVLETFKELMCLSSSGFALGYLTEIDPTHQNDLWGAVFSPEGTLFKSPLAHMACGVDAVASTTSYPVDPLFWCLGTAGNLYPLTGNSQALNSNQTTNMQVLGKFMAKMHRIALLWGTVGPQAQCNATPFPFLVKSQYRINPVDPVTTNGAPIYFGQSEYRWGLTPPNNYATHESTTYLIWQGQQCCMRF